MADAPNHRSEQTGNPAIDRIQNNVRELVSFVKLLLARVVGLETCFGRGIVRINMNDADLSLVSDARFAAGQLVLAGALSAGRTLTLPSITDDARSYFRWVTNVTSGGFSVTLKTQQGTLVVANGASEGVWVSLTGPGSVT